MRTAFSRTLGNTKHSGHFRFQDSMTFKPTNLQTYQPTHKMKVNRNLIFDVGMHKGEDTIYYLKKGFNVVAFEANPELVVKSKLRFSKEIKEGKLTIVEGAIVDKSKVQDKSIIFYKNEDNSEWGTIVKEWANRNENLRTTSKIIEVPTIDFRKCLEEFGIPHYLKIDIEGMDIICLESLLDFDKKPNYVSIESEKVSFGKLISEFELLESLGYDQFKLINQADIAKLNEPIESIEGGYLNYKFKVGSSGLFGSDFQTPWLSKETALRKFKWIFYGYKLWGDNSSFRNWLIMKFARKLLSKATGNTIPGWYDIHAQHSSVSKNKK